MPLTIVVVALLLLGLIRIVALLTVRNRAKERSESSTGPAASGPFAVFCIRQAFDSSCAIIWDTQIPALQLVDKTGIRGLPVRQLRPFYVRSARSYPELYDGTTFGGWLEFLERQLLISRSHGRLSITAGGRQFLAYRVVPEVVLAA